MMKKVKLSHFLIRISPFFAGIINGILGNGGGVPLVLALGKSQTISGKKIFATVNLSILFMSVISLVIFAFKTDFNGYLSSWVTLNAILGGVFGSLIFGKIPEKFLKITFSLLTIFAGLKMLYSLI